MEGKGSRNGFEESEGMSMQGEYSGVGMNMVEEQMWEVSVADEGSGKMRG